MMKILIASSSNIFDDSFKETQKNNSGFAHMVRIFADIFKNANTSVDVITQSNFTKGRILGGSYLLKKRWLDLARHYNFTYLWYGFKVVNSVKIPLSVKLRTILYYITGGYCEYIIQKNNYDIVHINGIGNSALPLILSCVRTNTPFVITLHGLISFNNVVKADILSKNIEKVILNQLKKNPNFLLTVVSSGVKDKICKYLDVEDLENVIVIQNPFIPVNE